MRLGTLMLLMGLSGCAASTATPVSLPTAINGIENDFRSAGVASGADLGTPAQVAAFDASVRKMQCSSDSANPILPVLNHDVSLNLSGQFTSGGEFSVTNFWRGLGGNVSRQQGQTVSADVTFLPLSELPDLYLQRELSALSGLDSKIAAPIQQGDVTKRDWLVDHVSGLEARYNPEQCPKARSLLP